MFSRTTLTKPMGKININIRKSDKTPIRINATNSSINKHSDSSSEKPISDKEPKVNGQKDPHEDTIIVPELIPLPDTRQKDKSCLGNTGAGKSRGQNGQSLLKEVRDLTEIRPAPVSLWVCPAAAIKKEGRKLYDSRDRDEILLRLTGTAKRAHREVRSQVCKYSRGSRGSRGSRCGVVVDHAAHHRGVLECLLTNLDRKISIP